MFQTGTRSSHALLGDRVTKPVFHLDFFSMETYNHQYAGRGSRAIPLIAVLSLQLSSSIHRSGSLFKRNPGEYQKNFRAGDDERVPDLLVAGQQISGPGREEQG